MFTFDRRSRGAQAAARPGRGIAPRTAELEAEELVLYLAVLAQRRSCFAAQVGNGLLSLKLSWGTRLPVIDRSLCRRRRHPSIINSSADDCLTVIRSS